MEAPRSRAVSDNHFIPHLQPAHAKQPTIHALSNQKSPTTYSPDISSTLRESKQRIRMKMNEKRKAMMTENPNYKKFLKLCEQYECFDDALEDCIEGRPVFQDQQPIYQEFKENHCPANATFLKKIADQAELERERSEQKNDPEIERRIADLCRNMRCLKDESLQECADAKRSAYKKTAEQNKTLTAWSREKCKKSAQPVRMSWFGLHHLATKILLPAGQQTRHM